MKNCIYFFHPPQECLREVIKTLLEILETLAKNAFSGFNDRRKGWKI